MNGAAVREDIAQADCGEVIEQEEMDTRLEEKMLRSKKFLPAGRPLPHPTPITLGITSKAPTRVSPASKRLAGLSPRAWQ